VASTTQEVRPVADDGVRGPVGGALGDLDTPPESRQGAGDERPPRAPDDLLGVHLGIMQPRCCNVTDAREPEESLWATEPRRP